MNTERVLVIERAKWLRGTEASSTLLDFTGHMCCLGFDALARGLTPEQILGIATPRLVQDAPISYRAIMCGGHILHIPPVVNAMMHNDDSSLDEAERERIIAEDLKQLGWDRVEFV